METVEGARSRILQRIVPLPSDPVPLDEALGRVLAENIVSARSVPAFDNASMDGYAVVAATTASPPQTLRVSGSIRAGDEPGVRLDAGTALRISTGAPLPAGSDAVVRVEDTDNGDTQVAIVAAVTPGTAVRRTGEDVNPGDTVVAAGTRLTPADLAAAAAVGLTTVAVHRRPSVALLATGDELVRAGTDPRPGQVVDCISSALAAAVREAGGIPLQLGIARDDPADIRQRLLRAITCDLIITAAGVSVGPHDHVRDVVAELGRIDFWQVAMRPGRPLAVGSLFEVPLLGLPGNPVSALVTFELFARPAILRLQNAQRLQRRRYPARLSAPIDTARGLETFVRGVLSGDGNPLLTVTPVLSQSSGATRSLAAADCLIVVAADVARIELGATVSVIPLR